MSGILYHLLMMETWKPVVRFEGHYEVSTLGRVRRTGRDRLGRCRNTMLRPSDRNGYQGVTLSVEGATTTVSVHRTMWEALVGSIPDGMQINHINGDRTDNRLENLEVCTPKQNMHHMRHVLKRRQVTPGARMGSANGYAKLTEGDVVRILDRLAIGDNPKRIAKDFGIHWSNVYKIKNKEAWAQCAPTPPVS